MSSCSSPFEVEAKRVVTTATTSDLQSLTFSEERSGSPGAFGMREKALYVVSVKNNSLTHAVVIATVSLLKGNQGFQLNNVVSPDTLDVKDSDRSIAHYNISFNPPGLGVFEDELLINTSTTTRWKLRATVVADSVSTVNIDSLSNVLDVSFSPGSDSAGTVAGMSLSAEVNSRLDTAIVIANRSKVHQLLIEKLTPSGDVEEVSLGNSLTLPIVLGRAGDINSTLRIPVQYKPRTVGADKIFRLQFGSTQRFDYTIRGLGFKWDTISVDANSSFCTVNTSQLDFKSVEVGSAVAKSFLINNTSIATKLGGSYVLVPRIRISGSSEADFAPETQTPILVGPNSSKACDIRFKPLTIGQKSVVVQLGSSAVGLAAIGLATSNRSRIDINVDSLSRYGYKAFADSIIFSDLALTTDAFQEVNVKNTTGAYLHIDSLHTIDSLNDGSLVIEVKPSMPLVIAPFGSCTVGARFRPTKSGISTLILQFGSKPDNRVIIRGYGR